MWLYPRSMEIGDDSQSGELDQVWTAMLGRAAVRADEMGKPEIAEYFRLRIANDVIRRAGLDWLINAAIIGASETQRIQPSIEIERIDRHRFAFGNSSMVGTAIDVRHGVRCLTVEAGWARVPGDGIMRGGALAHAIIRHFGLPKLTSELSLRLSDTTPQWFDGDGEQFTLGRLSLHFDLLIS